MITGPNTQIAIDAGPDFRMQMLREEVTRLDALLVTHEHRDHIGGIDDIRVFNYIKNGAMKFHCYPRVEKEIRQAFQYIFAEKRYPGIPEIHFENFEQTPFTIGDFHVQPIHVLHHKLPVAGFRIGNLAYITDVSHIPSTSLSLLKGLDVLVLGCLRKQPHISHFHLEKALEVIERIGAKKNFLIHMSHDMGLHDEVEAELPDHVKLSYDGLQIPFS